MKNVTVSLDDETYRRARIKAAEMDSSLSSLVRNFLNKLGNEQTEFECKATHEKELRERILARPPGPGTAERLTRDQIHDRAALRSRT